MPGINTGMKKNSLPLWVNRSFDEALTVAMTIRADGTMVDGAGRPVSPWREGAVPTLPTLIRALDRTVSELTRPKAYRSTKFIGWIGGDESIDCGGHFHALLELPPGINQSDFVDRFRARWESKVVEAFRTTALRTAVFDQPLSSAMGYSIYANRPEGATRARDSKVVMSGAMRL